MVGGAFGLALVLWFLLSCLKQKRIRNTFEKGTGGARRFGYNDLATATDNFSENRKLGEGAFGVVYSGFLKRLDREVAVKKIFREPSGENHKDFFAEVSTISEAKHKNLVKFFGWCCRGHSRNILCFMCSCWWKKRNMELFLVYELVNNGNLNNHLHNSDAVAVLPWPTRYKIVKDIGSALLYLHHDCKPYILHRDIKPGNILLDKSFNAKLADFGLSRIANMDSATLLTTAVGTVGYIDPQCIKDGKVRFNRSSDVYSFGILLLEIVCTGNSREHIWDLYEGGGNFVVESADKRLLATEGGFDNIEMERVIVLGLWCSSSEKDRRPTMWDVMDILNHGAPLPDRDSIVNSTLASTNDVQDTGSNHDEAPLFSLGMQ
uniref:Protein kinase domain-containing protein n=1 Tax=Oryza rufipogon TaxID=4529 RepID=A0A0E0P4X7_ORYRU